MCSAGRRSTRIVDVGAIVVGEVAEVREHSRKPDEFYDLVREVSPGPRIDVFSREKREGFDQWGNEEDEFQQSQLALPKRPGTG